MSEQINDEWQRLVANGILHQAFMTGEAQRQELLRPSVVFRPKISKDGDQWIALYGENLQDGVAGCGDTPDQAMHAFDLAWVSK